MSVLFEADGHKYTSVDVFEGIKWTSASQLIKEFKSGFDSDKKAIGCSTKKSSKWYGIPPDKIQEIWQSENKRSTDLGTWYHSKEEEKLLACETAEKYGKQLPIFKSQFDDHGMKIAPDQRLVEGIYPEHFMYLKSAGVCGQSDEVIVSDGYVHITDFKTNKDLKKPAFVDWKGNIQKFAPPLMHIEESKLMEYGLQFGIYLYMVLRHNPQLKPGNLTLNHVTFEIAGENQYGYPIMHLDGKGEPIVKGVEKIPVPYMKREVELMFEWLKNKKK